MRLELKNAELSLQENRPLGLVKGKGMTIHCIRGIAWLTIAGEAGDFLLTAGESYRLGSDGLALVEGVGQAGIRLEKAPCRLLAGFRRQRCRLIGIIG